MYNSARWKVKINPTPIVATVTGLVAFFNNAAGMTTIGGNIGASLAIATGASALSYVAGGVGLVAGGFLGTVLKPTDSENANLMGGALVGSLAGVAAGALTGYHAMDGIIEQHFGPDETRSEVASQFHGEMAQGYRETARNAIIQDAAAQGIHLSWEADAPELEHAPTTQHASSLKLARA